MAGITSTKKIKGQPHLLAYITPNEVEKLKALGGQETMTAEGIPAYPERDNYGYSSQSDFDSGNKSKSNDPNVNRDSTFETYRGNKNIGTDLGLMAKYGTPEQKTKARDALAKGQTYGYGPSQNVFEKMNTYNTNYRTNFVNRQIEKKKQALKDYLTSQYTQNPHMDVDEIMEGIMGSYDPATQTFGSYTFDKGLNKGFDFDLNNYAKGTQLGAFGLSANKKYGDKGKLGTKYLDQTPDFTSHPSTMPSFTGAFLNKVSPMNMNTLKSTLNRMNLLENMKTDGVTQAKIDDYYDRTMGRGDYDIFGGGGDGDGPKPYLPINYNTGAGTTEDVVEDKTFDYRFGTGQNVGADVRRASYIFNQGGRVPRAFGGIMDTATGRRAYGLGSVFKSVGKAIGKVGKAAGKVLSSDLGKAAIAGAMFYYGGGGMNVYNKGGGFFSGLGKMGAHFMSTKNPLLFNAAGKLSLGKLALGSAALPFLMPPAKPNEDIGMTARGGKLIDPITGKEAVPAEMRASLNEALDSADGDPDKIKAITNAYAFLGPDERLGTYLPYPTYGVKDGGRIGKAEGGLMNLGGMEKDYRAEGGFVPIGREEKADDVPARLSVNEFVFTADAVRNAGGGDIDKGAEVMENMMKNLENGGRVSEESQGNTGAQEMFSVSERIGEVI